MYAVVELNNIQYVIKKNEEIKVDKLSYDAKKTDLELKNVLLLNNDKETMIGKPYLKNVVVKAKIVKDMKDKKVVIFKYKKRKGYRKKQGHRQPYTILKIQDIKVS
ncbi:MAG: 50S ribosomal protein L21 [Spirochaetes bacterium]|nr:50S ribosomal protein L21 [Spirochaetota bacterium]